MIGTCFSGLAALDSNSLSASPGKQPWGARSGHENGPTRFPACFEGVTILATLPSTTTLSAIEEAWGLNEKRAIIQGAYGLTISEGSSAALVLA